MVDDGMLEEEGYLTVAELIALLETCDGGAAVEVSTTLRIGEERRLTHVVVEGIKEDGAGWVRLLTDKD